MRAANLALRFLLELCLLAALAAWGAQAGGSVVADVALAVLAPLAAAAVWGVFVAPRAPRRAPDPARLGLELLLFGLGAAALIAAGHSGLGLALGIVGALNAVLVRVGPLAEERPPPSPAS
jgi:Protein of unknown function (DUF2568)